MNRLRKRYGFTLVELLTVITIMGMLGAISITTVRGAVQSAKETQTRTTVAKIDSVLTGIYEKYQYRRLESQGSTIKERALSRLLKTRDLLRCDLPCTYDEVDVKSTLNRDQLSDYTPLQQVYRREIGIAASAGATDFPNINAELLYLVVMNADPEARATFSDREIADTDNNGLYEFVDGWGNPIKWMRWAPGLLMSDRQPLCYRDDALVEKFDADPFDPLEVVQRCWDDGQFSTGDIRPGWFLVPYVYSAGPDGEYGLVTPEVFGDDPSDMNDPFTYSRYNPDSTAGSPDGLKYKDNIDNHTLVR